MESHLQNLKVCFIVERADYSLYTPYDQLKALAFVLLASASIENYVERLCSEIGTQGCDRIKRGQPSATGRALLTWSVVRTSSREYPIHESDAAALMDIADQALTSYKQSIKSTHGMRGKDLRQLVFPLGLRDNQLPQAMILSLDALADKRDPASHIYVNRAKLMTEPIAEWDLVSTLMTHFTQLDKDLQNLVENYPV